MTGSGNGNNTEGIFDNEETNPPLDGQQDIVSHFGHGLVVSGVIAGGSRNKPGTDERRPRGPAAGGVRGETAEMSDAERKVGAAIGPGGAAGGSGDRTQDEPLFSIVMTVFDPWVLFPHALESILRQTWQRWELVVVSDGACDPLVALSLASSRSRWRGHRVEQQSLERAEGCWGNRGRAWGLDWARGDRVVWVNHDNLIGPDYLAAHAAAAARSPGAVTVVEIELWQKGRYRGRYPKGLRRSRIDLLNYSLPVDVARQVAAFGPEMEREYAADGTVFEAAAAIAPVEWERICAGAHF